MHDHRRRAAPATTRNSWSVKKRHPSQDKGWNVRFSWSRSSRVGSNGFCFLLGWWMICWASVMMAVLMRQRGSCRGSGPRRGEGCLVSLLPWVYGMDGPCLQIAADSLQWNWRQNIFAKQGSRNQNWMLSWWDRGCCRGSGPRRALWAWCCVIWYEDLACSLQISLLWNIMAKTCCNTTRSRTRNPEVNVCGYVPHTLNACLVWWHCGGLRKDILTCVLP